MYRYIYSVVSGNGHYIKVTQKSNYMIYLHWILYLLAILILTVICTLVLFLVIDRIFYAVTSGKNIGEESKFVNSFGIPIVMIASVILSLFILNAFSLNPPTSVTELAISSDKTIKEIEDLNNEMSAIDATLSDIENLTLNEIRSELANTLEFIEKLRIEAIEREKQIEILKDVALKEQNRASTAIERAEEIEKLTHAQLEAVRFILTENAKEENSRSFWRGVLISFPIGIVASLISNYIFGRIRKKKSPANKA